MDSIENTSNITFENIYDKNISNLNDDYESLKFAVLIGLHFIIGFGICWTIYNN